MKFRNLFILTILTICLASVQTFACLQAVGRFVVGKEIMIERVSVDTFMKDFLTHEDRASWENVLAELEVQKKTDSRISVTEISNNRAVALIHLGQIQEAIKILEEIERQTPDLYLTAANLGTAYELNGENQKALKWIKEGIKRNEESHRGTEWLHVKILEAKLAMKKDAKWLKNNSVLGANFNDENQTPPKIYATDFLGQQKSLAEIEEALVYQLHERLEFVKAPEPIVADLLFDLSKVFAVSRTLEHAKAINELAVKYAGNSEELAKGRIIEADSNDLSKGKITEQVEIPEKNQPNYLYYAISAIGVLLLVGFIYIIYRRQNLP